MRKRGLVERGPIPDAANDRAIQAALTEQGLSALRKAARQHGRDVRELVVDVLDDWQLEQLGETSDALLRQLQPS
jgi:DNA-binding MarR family transcriptional regulator